MADVYEITGQTERMVFGPDNRPVAVRTVAFTTKPSNVVGSVDVPVAGYNADTVDAAVRPIAVELERVRAL